MHVLLIDDDQDLSAMLAEYLEGENIRCRVTHDPFEGLRLALTNEFDAVILDVMMPRLDGVELLRQLRATSTVPVVMLTAKGDSVERVVGLELGADDYIPKPVYPRELIARIRAVLRRVQLPTATESKDNLVFGDIRISVTRRQCWVGADELPLTATELNLLVHLVRGGGDLSSKADLSTHVLGRRHESYDRSVDVHVSKLRSKLMTAGANVTIETVRGMGYRLQAPQ